MLDSIFNECGTDAHWKCLWWILIGLKKQNDWLKKRNREAMTDMVNRSINNESKGEREGGESIWMSKWVFVLIYRGVKRNERVYG